MAKSRAERIRMLSRSAGGGREVAHSAIFAVLLTLAASSVAHAQPAKTTEDTTTAEAKQRFSEGVKYADQGDHEAARLKFSQAWSLLKSPAILYNLARSEQLSNHLVEALGHYRMFAKMASDPKVTEQQKQRAAENQAELTKKLGQIEIDAPASAKLTIDGKAIEWAPNADPFPVVAGKHVVEATTDGKTKSVTVDCDAGTVTKATLTEPPAPPTPPPPPPVAEPPREAPGGFWTTGRAVGAGLAGASVLAVGAGILFQLKAGTAGDDASTARNGLPSPKGSCLNPTDPTIKSECGTIQSKLDDQASDQNLRTIFLVGGGALIAGGVVLFLVSPPKNSEPTRGFRFLPYASADGAGFTAFGRF